MAKKQRLYTPEFRQQMVELIRAGRKYAEMADDHGLHVGLPSPAMSCLIH